MGCSQSKDTAEANAIITSPKEIGTPGTVSSQNTADTNSLNPVKLDYGKEDQESSIPLTMRLLRDKVITKHCNGPPICTSSSISPTEDLRHQRSGNSQEDEEFWSKVIEAIEHDGEILHEYTDPKTSSSPLHEICKLSNPRIDVMQMLILSCGKNSILLAKDTYGNIPLHYAITMGDLNSDVLQFLIDATPKEVAGHFSTKQHNQTEMTMSPLYRAVQMGKDRSILLAIHNNFPHMLCKQSKVSDVDTITVKDTPMNLLWRRYHNQKWECEKFFPGDNSLPEVVSHRSKFKKLANETRDTLMDMLQVLSSGRIVHAAGSLASVAPLELLQVIILKNPNEIGEQDEEGKLPLHHAAMAKTFTPELEDYQGKFVIDTLLKLCPSAAQVKDSNGNLPLTLAIQAGKSLNAGIQSIYDAFPSGLENANDKSQKYIEIRDALIKSREPSPEDEVNAAIFVVQRPDACVGDITGAMWAHKTDAGLQMLALIAIANLASKDDDSATAVALAGGAAAIVNAMSSHPNEPIVQEKACKALQLLSIANKKNELYFAAIGAISAIINAMQDNPNDTMVQLEACGALGILGRDADGYTTIVSTGGVASIVQAMETNPNEQALQREACAALKNLCAFSTPSLPVFSKEELIPVLEAAAQRFPKDCKKNVDVVMAKL